MTRRRISLLSILVMAAVTALGVYLIQSNEKTLRQEPIPLPVPVEVVKISAKNFTHHLEALGTVRAIREAAVGAEITGPVKRIPDGIELGRAVDRGTLLAEIDPTSFRIEVKYREALAARAQAQVRAKKVGIASQQTLIPINKEKLRLARAEHNRLQKLLDKNLIAQQDVERAELTVRRIQEELERAESGLQEAEVNHAVTRADLASSQAELALARKALSDTRVQAPFPGIISEKQVTVGEQLERGRVLFRLADISTVKVLIRVPPDEIHLLRQGTLANVTVSVMPVKFQGRVEHIGPRADDETRSFPVEVLVKNVGPKRLLPGMFARAAIPIHTYPNATLIPRSSILSDSGTSVVFIAGAKQKIARRRPVILGRYFGSRYLVKEGLKSGDLLVVVGQHLLKDGAAIRVIDTRGLEP